MSHGEHQAEEAGPARRLRRGPAQSQFLLRRLLAPHFIFSAIIGWSLLYVFQANIWLGWFVVAYLAICLVLVAVARRHPRSWRSGPQKFGAVCFIAPMFIVGGLSGLALSSWKAYEILGWIAAGLLAIGVVLDLLDRLSALMQLLAGMFVAAVAAAAIIVPAPPQAGAVDNSWKAVVTVTDENGEPLPGARVLCASVMVWETADPTRAGHGYSNGTDEVGRAEFSFTDDPRLKAAACRAEKDATGTDPGYAPQHGFGRPGAVPHPSTTSS